MPQLRRSLKRVAATTTLLLAAGVMQPAFAGTDPSGPQPGPTPALPAAADDKGAQVAAQALENAEAALSGQDDLDPTLALLEVKQTLDDLSPADRKRATRLLARPTDNGTGEIWEVEYDGRKVQHDCTAHFCVHWVEAGNHAPSLGDSDNDNVPDYVETVAKVMEHIWAREVDDLNYRRPLSDGTTENPNGDTRSGLVDVYLGEIGSLGIYGYTATDARGTRVPAYLVLDNDFEEFHGNPTDLLKVTAAHEFFHAVQFAYAVTEDGWLMESTATWMEERVYDGINDNRQFLSRSALKRPQVPLDQPSSLYWYGNWIFFEHLSATHGTKVVRQIWNRAAKRRVNSMQAINRALGAHGSNLPTAFSRFSADNNMPKRTYAEGAAYGRAQVTDSWRLGKRTRSRRTTGSHTVRLQHMSSRNYTFKPRRGTTRKWRVRIKVTAPSHNARAYVLVHLKNGKVRRRTMELNDAGKDRVWVHFARKRVRRVTLNVANASIRYRCFRNTSYTCSGEPRDDRRKFTFRADLRRR